MAVLGDAGSCGVAALQLVVVGLAAGLALGAVTGASAAAAAEEPIAAGAGGAEVGSCARPLVDVMWGFVLVLLAIAVSVWGRFKSTSKSKSYNLFLLLAGVGAPLHDLGMVLENSWKCVAMVWKCHKLEDPEMRLLSLKWARILLSLSNPWSKLPARILPLCDIVVYLLNGASQEMPSEQSEGLEKAEEGMKRGLDSPLKSNGVSCGRCELLAESWAWLWESVDVEDESEAMVVGKDAARECKNEYYEKKQLTLDGKLALLWGTYFLMDYNYNFMPNYGELKFLRGNSGFATVAIAIQAIGYIYAILFRSMKGLRVAPVEVIGLILNIILLVKASNYSTSNACHRPLVIYMNEGQEEKFLGVLNSKSKSSFHLSEKVGDVITSIILLIILLCVEVPLVYYIVILRRDTNMMIVIPLICFSIGLFGDFVSICVGTFLKSYASYGALFICCTALNLIAYIWAMVIALQYWKAAHFNTRPELVDLSQIIPFVG